MAIILQRDESGRLRPPERDDSAREMIEWVLEHGKLGVKLLSLPCENMAQAELLRSRLYRSARYYCGCGLKSCSRKYRDCPDGEQRLSMRADVVHKNGQLRVQFTVYDKNEGRRYVIETHGDDPEKWPYRPGRKILRG